MQILLEVQNRFILFIASFEIVLPGTACLSVDMENYTFPSRVRRSSLELAHANPQLLIRGLPSTIGEDALVDILSKFGELQSCKLFQGSEGSTSDAFAQLSSRQQAEAAISALNGAPTSTGILEVIARPSIPSEHSFKTPHGTRTSIFLAACE